MYIYDTPRRLPYSSPLPALRPARDATGGSSATPIYDALYAEYLRTFRALPGDRLGEEEMGFTAFGIGPHGPGLNGPGLLAGGPYHSGSAAYTPTVYGLRQVTGQHQTGYAATHQSQTVTSVRQPAALPPAPRRER
ncbi:hypothetical protein ACPYPG_15370 [Streptomyces sp. FR-108]|uniref:hypothetical protein n=1 Tax=Streptomyces sp. FR-108 TaxID=3416665 RepID=UPI003CEA955B